jgi:hypothetical protein
MSFDVHASLVDELTVAHRIIETFVMRSKSGAVFTIAVGENLLPESGATYGAKITQWGEPETHLGICEGPSLEKVCDAAQKVIARAIQSGAARPTLPRPHLKHAGQPQPGAHTKN